MGSDFVSMWKEQDKQQRDRITALEEALRVLAKAGRAANVISKCAQHKYGTYVVTGADVARCDEAIVAIESNEIAAEAVRKAGG